MTTGRINQVATIRYVVVVLLGLVVWTNVMIDPSIHTSSQSMVGGWLLAWLSICISIMILVDDETQSHSIHSI